MTAFVFIIILGVLLFMLAWETVVLIGLILQLVGQLTVLAFLLLKLIVMAMIQVGIWICDLYRGMQRRRDVEEQGQWLQIPHQVVLVDRGDGVHVPSRGEW